MGATADHVANFVYTKKEKEGNSFYQLIVKIEEETPGVEFVVKEVYHASFRDHNGFQLKKEGSTRFEMKESETKVYVIFDVAPFSFLGLDWYWWLLILVIVGGGVGAFLLMGGDDPEDSGDEEDQKKQNKDGKKEEK